MKLPVGVGIFNNQGYYNNPIVVVTNISFLWSLYTFLRDSVFLSDKQSVAYHLLLRQLPPGVEAELHKIAQ